MRVLVAGAAHLDILAHVTGDESTVDKIGTVAIEVGGTCCNIAVDLANFGAKVSLLTAFNLSPYSTLITEFLADQGVEVLAEYKEEMPVGAFCAQISRGGELQTAVTCSPLEDHVFSETVLAGAFEDIDAVVLDCNLNPAALEDLVRRASAIGCPLFVAAVSEQKALRLAALPAATTAMFLNRIESTYLLRHVLGEEGTLQALAAQFGTPLIVTDGDQGAEVISPGEPAVRVSPPSIEVAGNLLGAGDGLMAATIFHFVQGASSLPAAVERATEVISHLARRGNCNLSKPGYLDQTLTRIASHAKTDAMTQTLNRAATAGELNKRFAGAMAGKHALSVAMVDIDKFKSINDTFGHDAGDKVIQAVVERIRHAVRGKDVVGRWGGEEFIVVTSEAIDIATTIAERIRTDVEASVLDPRPVTVSIGVAQFDPAKHRGVTELVKDADVNLYAAKNGGRNRVIWQSQESATDREPAAPPLAA